MIRKICLTALSVLMLQNITAQKPMTVQEYINTYKNLAIEEMKRAGIPASITMAQGLLESNNGGSRLATLANNHFGIKCQVEWTGPSITHDDDAKGECFRKYSDPAASYRDHSEFLTTRSRYAFLFDYPITDYKSWANGLKTAGYATNPEYANALIRIIETNSLHLLDQQEAAPQTTAPTATQIASAAPTAPAAPGMVINLTDPDAQYVIEKVNGIRAVKAREGDTFASIAAALRKKAFILAGYNELPFNTELKEGQVVYLFKKYRKYRGEASAHIVEKGESMHSISQRYGVEVRSLYRINLMPEDYKIEMGERILLK